MALKTKEGHKTRLMMTHISATIRGCNNKKTSSFLDIKLRKMIWLMKMITEQQVHFNYVWVVLMCVITILAQCTPIDTEHREFATLMLWMYFQHESPLEQPLFKWKRQRKSTVIGSFVSQVSNVHDDNKASKQGMTYISDLSRKSKSLS